MDYRQRMRDLREDHDLSQAAVGRIINKSQQGYSHIENGRADLSIEDMITLCRFYQVSLEYFAGLTDIARSPDPAVFPGGESKDNAKHRK